MEYKDLTFTVYQLIFRGQDAFDLNEFDSIRTTELDSFKVGTDEQSIEILSLKQLTKEKINERYVFLSFKEGDKWPYPKTVINSELEEIENPRRPEEIELTDQYYILIDKDTRRIYFSNGKKRNLFAKWLEEKTGKQVSIKAVISHGDFLAQLKTVKQLSFAVTPNLVHQASENSLIRALTENVYGLDAEKARVVIEFKSTRVTDVLKEKFRGFFNLPQEFEDLTLIGYSDDRLESIFNINSIINRFMVKVLVDPESKQLNSNVVRDALITAINPS